MLKELVYLKGYAKGKNLINTIKAITIANNLHTGQTRLTGEPYISHPARVAKQLLNLGLDDDSILATAIMHDTLEDCKITRGELEKTFDHKTYTAIELVTKNKNIAEQDYINNILDNEIATLVKISDRCHNVSTMAGGFSNEKINSYINETKMYYIPLCKAAIDKYPNYSDSIYAMKLQIEAICNALEIALNLKGCDK